MDKKEIRCYDRVEVDNPRDAWHGSKGTVIGECFCGEDRFFVALDIGKNLFYLAKYLKVIVRYQDE